MLQFFMIVYGILGDIGNTVAEIVYQGYDLLCVCIKYRKPDQL